MSNEAKINGLTLVVLLGILLFYHYALPSIITVKGVVENVETVSMNKHFLGNTFYIRVKFKNKESVLLHGNKEDTQIEEGKAYKITISTDNGILGFEIIE